MSRREHCRERLGRERGRKFETLTNRDGATYQIRYVATDRIFFATPEKALEFVSEDVNEVREELEEYMREHVELEWEPVIEIQLRAWSNSDLGLEYMRKFRAKKVNGTFVYRHFDSERVDGIDADDVLEGHPGAATSPNNLTHRIAYTSERWKFLRKMTKSIGILRSAIGQFVEQHEDDLVDCLDGKKTFTPVVTHLLASPEGPMSEDDDDLDED